MTELFNKVITIYNDIPSDGVNPRRFERHVVPRCLISVGTAESVSGTIQNIVNAVTLVTKSVANYKSPSEYAKLPEDVRQRFYTAQIDDFVVFAEVDDLVETAKEFQSLQNKYKNQGMIISSVNENLYGLAVDNVTMTSV